jgi:hypothetical protein
MPFATTIIQGRSGTFLLSDPRPRIKINRGDVDEREDTWHADAFPHTLLFEGAPHPQFPGLILDTADFEEFAPAFPPVPGFDGQAGDYRAACRWLGNAQSTEREGATKLISRGMERSLGPNFDEIPFSYLSWTAEPRAITGTASTDTIHLPGNPFQNGQRVVLVQLTGGTGLTGQSTSSLGTVYYVINRTADGLQLATTLGGSALDFTTDITAGHILDARFALGAPHPDYPAMFLAKLSLRDNYTSWKNATCHYMGKAWDKPYHEVVTVNGQSASSSEPITIGLTGGWPSTPHHTNFHLPEVVLTRTYLTSDTLPTASVPSIATPANAPAIQSLVLTGDDDFFTWTYPYGWSFMAAEHVETISPSISIRMDRYQWRYIWPLQFR